MIEYEKELSKYICTLKLYKPLWYRMTRVRFHWVWVWLPIKRDIRVRRATREKMAYTRNEDELIKTVRRSTIAWMQRYTVVLYWRVLVLWVMCFIRTIHDSNIRVWVPVLWNNLEACRVRNDLWGVRWSDVQVLFFWKVNCTTRSMQSRMVDRSIDRLVH